MAFSRDGDGLFQPLAEKPLVKFVALMPGPRVINVAAMPEATSLAATEATG